MMADQRTLTCAPSSGTQVMNGLHHSPGNGKVDERWREFMHFQIKRALTYFEDAEAGVDLLDAKARWPVWCVGMWRADAVRGSGPGLYWRPWAALDTPVGQRTAALLLLRDDPCARCAASSSTQPCPFVPTMTLMTVRAGPR